MTRVSIVEESEVMEEGEGKRELGRFSPGGDVIP